MAGPEAIPVAHRARRAVTGLRGHRLWLATGWSVWFWLGPIIILGVVPAIDLFAGLDRSNPPDDVIEALEKDRYYRWITYLYLPIQYAGFIGAMWIVSGASPWELRAVERIGLAVSIGCIGGIGINTAHELGHKREENERWLSKIALAQSFYGHFYIEHNRGHHVRVATPEDPASSRMGESFYEFWPRTVWGSVRSAWRLEKRRIGRRKQHPFRLSNDVLNAWLMSAVLWAALLLWLGIGIAPYLVIQAVVGFTLLEVVNYMEHYGMLRQKVGLGERQRYERVDPSHSWNSNNIATNVLLYHLQRHSDHHANPTRRYQTLRDFEESPSLPTGYAGMIVLALVPPVWRRVMDPRVLRHVDGDLTRANLSPRKREGSLGPVPAARGAGGCRGATRLVVGGGGGRGARGTVPGLRLHLRRRHGRGAGGLRRRDRVGADPRRLVLPRLRRAREGRLRGGVAARGMMSPVTSPRRPPCASASSRPPRTSPSSTAGRP